MSYAIIGWTDMWSKRGAFSEAYNLECLYPNKLKTFDGRLINRNTINTLHNNYDRLIYTYQNTINYRKKNLIDVKYALSDIVFCRKEINPGVKYKSTNGFSIYKYDKSFINFIPMILPTFKKDEIKNTTDKIVLGYYYRPVYRPDDFHMFCNFIKYNLNTDVELYVMGGWLTPYPFDKISKHITKLNYTKSNIEFWNNVTHYVYSESNVYDPWPTTLQEAVNLDKQIIMLEQKKYVKDGISDIEEMIKYHKNKIEPDIYYSNVDCILNNWNYDNFYQEVFNNKFEYNFDRNKYKYFKDWLEIW